MKFVLTVPLLGCIWYSKTLTSPEEVCIGGMKKHVLPGVNQSQSVGVSLRSYGLNFHMVINIKSAHWVGICMVMTGALHYRKEFG